MNNNDKKRRHCASTVDLHELLQKFEALSLVVKEEIPDVLKAKVDIP